MLFGWFRCLRSLEGACHVVLSLFLLICLLFKLRMPYLSSYILDAGFRWAGSFGFEIGSRGLAPIFVLLGLVFLWSTRGEGCPTNLVL